MTQDEKIDGNDRGEDPVEKTPNYPVTITAGNRTTIVIQYKSGAKTSFPGNWNIGFRELWRSYEKFLATRKQIQFEFNIHETTGKNTHSIMIDFETVESIYSLSP